MPTPLPMLDDPNELRQCTLFAYLHVSKLEALGQMTRLVQFKQGECLTEIGADARDMFFILNGSVKVFYTEIVDANEEVKFEMSGAGDFLGEVGILTGKRSATARAEIPTQVLVLDKEQWLMFIEEFPDVISAIMRKSAERTARMTQSLRETPRDINKLIEDSRSGLDKSLSEVVKWICTGIFFAVNMIAVAGYLWWCKSKGFVVSGSWYAGLGMVLSIEATLISLMVLVKQRGDETTADIRFAKLYRMVQMIPKSPDIAAIPRRNDAE